MSLTGSNPMPERKRPIFRNQYEFKTKDGRRNHIHFFHMCEMNRDLKKLEELLRSEEKQNYNT